MLSLFLSLVATRSVLARIKLIVLWNLKYKMVQLADIAERRHILIGMLYQFLSMKAKVSNEESGVKLF